MNRLICFFLILSYPFFPAKAAEVSTDFFCSFRVAGYYPDFYAWQFPVPDIRFDKLTDIIYFSIYPNADGTLNTSEIYLPHQQELIETAHLQNTRVSICVGGWNLSQHFSAVAANPSLRAALVNNLVQYCLTYGFDGVDLDWEPVTLQTDQQNYTLLIGELKAALLPHQLTLSVAVGAMGSEFQTSAIGSIDWLHIMAYDMGLPHSSYEMAVTALAHWESFGFPRSKMILGLPFYGRDDDLYGDYYRYYWIIQTWSPPPDADEIAGINFNGVSTISRKIRHVIENGYGGVMIWEITSDTADATSLLSAISSTAHLYLPADFNCDNQVDSRDLNHFILSWLRADCSVSNAWCSAADRDQSHSVDLTDLSLFARDWLLP